MPKQLPSVKPPHTERKRTQPSRAYLFDVDGVLTNPEAKRVEQPEIFDELVKRLERRDPVGLNTGRSLEFMIEQVLEPLEARLVDKQLLQNLFAVGEKGGAWIVYDDDNQRSVQIDDKIRVLQDIQEEVRTMVAKSSYSKTMFYDETKRTMVSVEVLPADQRQGKSFDDFKAAQSQLVNEFHNIIKKYHQEEALRIDPTRIATDIENVRVGKALGAKKFVELLEERGIEPLEYIGFGDSTSDYDMQEELQRLGKRAQFVFVGGREHLAGKSDEEVIFTEGHVDKGTLEFLQNEK